ncbi:MAG: DUF2169 domain-containing protein [Candidatus Accumulibacter sp.]|jgi:hypothetical protein|nr:DUF2169 domain-containing protein [Accumulibacter sp.]
MWQLDNKTPFAADAAWIWDCGGGKVWAVAVKATYDIAPDGCTVVSRVQIPVSRGPRQDEAGVPLGETDLHPFKRRTDILLLGHAHSPLGKRMSELPIGFCVGKLKREAIVFGDRRWECGAIWLRPGKPKPFVSMPLHWGRAFGGVEPQTGESLPNPVGRGLLDAGPDPLLPNIEHPLNRISRPQDRPEAVGFGPVPGHWHWRARHAGTYDDAWRAARSPLLPLDIHPDYWQIAPPEQQYPGVLQGGEEIALVHLTQPWHSQRPGRLKLVLPALSLRFDTWFYSGAWVCGRSQIHTVILEPDHPRITVVHLMSLPCVHAEQLDRTIITIDSKPPATRR